MASRNNDPRCVALNCIHNRFSIEQRTTVCTLLTECLMNYETGDCPFFAKPAEAEESRRRAVRRARERHVYNADGTYSQHFNKVCWVKQPDGSEKGEVVADIPAWLNHLANEGIITRAYADQQIAKFMR